MYSFYVVLKYTLHWIVIAFRDLGNALYILAYPLLLHDSYI